MMDKLTIGIAIFAALEISIILVAIWKFSGLVGKADTTNELSKTIMPISAIIAAIIIIHTVLWYFYFQYEPMAMNLYFLITGSMTMVFSLIAVSISLCQKS
jgi:hypothetical protein